MKKIFLLLWLIIFSALALTGCGNQPTDQKSVEPANTATEIKEFSLTAKQWEFIPAEISVNRGDRVRLKIKSVDVTHGLALPDFNLNVEFEPNQEKVVEFTANKAGVFPFTCSVLCGAGHREMKGKLTVK